MLVLEAQGDLVDWISAPRGYGYTYSDPFGPPAGCEDAWQRFLGRVQGWFRARAGAQGRLGRDGGTIWRGWN